MATVTVKQFNLAQEVADYLNDIVLTKALTTKTYGLHGLTLLINDTVNDYTVTFDDPTDQGLNPAEIVHQINTAEIPGPLYLTGCATIRNYGHMTAPLQVYVVFAKENYVIDQHGTANAALGLSTTADLTVGANAVAKADIVAITSDAAGVRYTILHY
jgi:hypothetical protein